MSTILKPLYEKIVIEEIDEENVSEGGIVMPETTKRTQFTGKVVSVGEGHLTKDGDVKPLVVEVDDQVVFHKTSAEEIELEGNTFFVIKEQDIVGIISPDRTE